MLNPNNNRHIGRVLLRLDPRKHYRRVCEWKQCCFLVFDYRGVVVHYEFPPESQIINGNFHLALLRLLRVEQREMWNAGIWLLRHDNAPAHTALSIKTIHGKTFDRYPSTAPLFTWPLPSQIFSVPCTQNLHSKEEHLRQWKTSLLKATHELKAIR
jgi:hypothetical protein